MSISTHGDLVTYQRDRCRCDLCRAANTEYHRNYRARRAGLIEEIPRRGGWCQVCKRKAIPQYLAASVGPRFQIVGTMLLCADHANPEVVETSWWEPGARMVPTS